MIRSSILAISVMVVTVVWTQTFVGDQVVSFGNAKTAGGGLPVS